MTMTQLRNTTTDVQGWDDLAVIHLLGVKVRTPGTHIVRHGHGGVQTEAGTRLAGIARRSARKARQVYGLQVQVRNNAGHLLITVREAHDAPFQPGTSTREAN